jgi:hypothetical protein
MGAGVRIGLLSERDGSAIGLLTTSTPYLALEECDVSPKFTMLVLNEVLERQARGAILFLDSAHQASLVNGAEEVRN